MGHIDTKVAASSSDLNCADLDTICEPHMGQVCCWFIMQNLLGEVVDLDAVNLEDAMEAPLDSEFVEDSSNILDNTLDCTTNNNNNDYAAGYVVIIQKLMELDKRSAQDSGHLDDIRNMLTDVYHSVGRLATAISLLTNENIMLKDKLQEVYEMQNSVLTATTNATTSLSDIIEAESPSSVHTQQVSSTVPACVIYSMWTKNYPNEDLGADVEYLRKVCHCIFPTLPNGVKSALGMKLKVHIDNYHKQNMNVGADIMMALCGEQNNVCAEGRRAIFETLRLLGTTYAFMIPNSLAMLLSRTTTMDNGRITIVKDPRIADMVGAGHGYDIIPINLIDQAKVRTCLTNLHKKKVTASTLRTFIKCIQTGTITKDGGMVVDPNGKKIKALFSDDVPRAQQSSSSLDSSHIDSKPPGSSRFASFKKGQK